MKKEYQKPEIINKKFVIIDVITASSVFANDFGNTNDESIPWEDII